MKKSIVAVVALVAVTLLLNLHNAHREFLYDDYAVFVTNKIVAARDFGQIWSTPYWSGVSGVAYQENLHRPLFLSIAAWLRTHKVLLRLLVSLAHIGVGLLGWSLLNRRYPDRRWLNFGFMSLFLLHPVQVETTAQVIGMMEVVPAVLGLSALLLIESRPWLALALVAIAPGFKEIGYGWLGSLSLVFLWRRQFIQGGLAMVITAGWLALRYWISNAFFESYNLPYVLMNPLTGAGFWDSFWTRFALLGHNLRIFFWPVGLTSDYSRGTLPLPGYFIQLWVLLGIGFCVYLYRSRKTISTEALVAMASLLPTLQLTGPTGIIFAERYGYSFRLGLIFCLAPFVMRVWDRYAPSHRRRAAIVVALAALSVYAMSWHRYDQWNDAETLFTADMQKYPQNAKLHFNLGVVYGGQSRWDDAKRELMTSINLSPDFPEAHFKLGYVYRSMGDEKSAQQEWGIADQLGYDVEGKRR